MERQYFLHNGTDQTGPFTLDAIRAAKPPGVKHVWYEGLSGWVPLEQCPEVLSALRAEQPAPPQPPPASVGAQGSTTAPAQPAPVDMVESRRRRNLANEIESLYSNTVTFFVLFFVSLVLTILLAVVFGIDDNEAGVATTLILGFLAVFAFVIVHIVNWCKLHYRYWRVAVQYSGFREISPDQAVGFLFIPLFNLYWCFRSYQTLSEQLNKILKQEKYEGRGPLVNESTTTAMCVL
ncbi:MAG TPA: DUF4339 domain-containing protein, partial [Flavobacteriales bacterium]|nr:DUF4339 domain-containing protein [Flavobacteriales bacterium]